MLANTFCKEEGCWKFNVCKKGRDGKNYVHIQRWRNDAIVRPQPSNSTFIFEGGKVEHYATTVQGGFRFVLVFGLKLKKKTQDAHASKKRKV